MRVAIVNDFYLDYIGGAQSSIHEQRAALTAAGHTVYLVCGARMSRRKRFRMLDDGLEVRPAYTLPGFMLPVISARRPLIAALKRYFTEQRIDVVHLQTEFGLAHAATTAAQQLGIPVVHTVHTFYWQSSGRWQGLVTPIIRFGLQWVTRARIPRLRYSTRPSDNLLRNLTLGMARRADTVVSPSSHQADDLTRAGVHGPVEVVPNTIARSNRPASKLTATQLVKPKLLWVARCELEKRPLVFAEAVMDALARTGGAFEVDFVGEGSLLAELRRRTAGHPDIRVHGALDHKTVLDLMDAASLVCLSSFGFDNQPMTIAEAVSRYRGVLYCDPKLSEGLRSSGYLSATPDARDIADAIVELVTDEVKLLALSSGAELDSAIFSAEGYVQRIVGVYTAAGSRTPIKG